MLHKRKPLPKNKADYKLLSLIHHVIGSDNDHNDDDDDVELRTGLRASTSIHMQYHMQRTLLQGQVRGIKAIYLFDNVCVKKSLRLNFITKIPFEKYRLDKLHTKTYQNLTYCVNFI